MSGRTGSIDLSAVKARLGAGTGGYEVAHESPGLELGVYVLVAPEPDRQQPHADDEVYVVLEGRGALEIDGATVPLVEGQVIERHERPIVPMCDVRRNHNQVCGRIRRDLRFGQGARPLDAAYRPGTARTEGDSRT